MAAEPSVAFAEAFKSISHATVNALRAYEQGSRSQATQIEHEMRHVRRERDEALADMHAARQEEQEWRHEAEKWKAAVEKAEVTNVHQAELVVQLRDEAHQWKQQCLRLEEASRQEIQDWKDQFLRVDAERMRLMARLEQLATDSQAKPAIKRTPFTPRIKNSSTADPGALLASAPPSAPGPNKAMKTPSAPSEPAVRHPSAKKPRQSQPVPVVQMPAQRGKTTPGEVRVIRRVQAVIEVPVKEEENADEEGVEVASMTSGSGSGGAVKRRNARAGPSRRVIEDEESGLETGDDDDDGEYVDERSSRPTATRKRRLVSDEDEDEDDEEDELMMGAGDDSNDLFGTQRVVSSSVQPKRTPNAKSASATTPSASASKKRKQIPAESGPSATKPRKRR